MTLDVIKTMKKKTNAILKMGKPYNKTKASSFFGVVNYYKSFWPQCDHLLAPLSELTESADSVELY